MPNISLLQGDCLQVLKTLEDKSVDLILTDPPYGMNFRSNYRNIKHKKIPVELIEELIKCNVGDTILDPFMGSGTTGHAG